MPVWMPPILFGCSPPPEDKTPSNLIYCWGVEMLGLGFELAMELFEEAQGGQEDAHGKR